MWPVPATLLVHGIWDDGRKLERLAAGLRARGIGPVVTIDLVPADGRAPIPELARSVDARARSLAEAHGRIDLVGFSMGALVSRYVVQRLSGKATVRRFVSISGPHAGTRMAGLWPDRLGARDYAGVRDMRRDSALLDDLRRDADPFGPVEVHVLYTRFDAMIVPATSSRLPGARSETVLSLPLHRMMITHEAAIAAVAARLVDDQSTSTVQP